MGGNFLGGNFPGRGNSPRGSLMGGNFPGGSFPDTTFNKLWINSQNKWYSKTRAYSNVTWRWSVKMVFLKISQNSHKNKCLRVSFWSGYRPKSWKFIEKDTLTQVFSCRFCETLKNTNFYETLLVCCFLTFFIYWT